jgi:hypothetical protein
VLHEAASRSHPWQNSSKQRLWYSPTLTAEALRFDGRTSSQEGQAGLGSRVLWALGSPCSGRAPVSAANPWPVALEPVSMTLFTLRLEPASGAGGANIGSREKRVSSSPYAESQSFP